jgi:hypothetical protein
MNDELDSKIRNLVHRAVDTAPMAPAASRIEMRDAPHPRRTLPNWAIAFGSAAMVMVLVVGVVVVLRPDRDDPADPGVEDEAPAARWAEVAPSPLSPRTHTTMVWTGAEVLVIGGDTFACPPGALCENPVDPPLADGAAYDPVANRWRRIADAPVGFDASSAVLHGQDVYVSTFDTPLRSDEPLERLLRYSLVDDRWFVIEHPGTMIARLISRGRDNLVAEFAIGDSPPLQVLDAASGTWSDLPHSPLTRGFDTTTVAFDGDLYQFDHSLDRGATDPWLTRVARYAASTQTWTRLDDLPMLSVGPWFRDGDRLIAPEGGSEDGGDVNNWGREVPYGGVFDTVNQTWTPLPTGGRDESAGVIGENGALFTATSGSVLDLRTDSWITMPDLGHEPGAVVAAGRDAFAFGGVDWDEGESHEPLGGAWIWRTGSAGPPPASGTEPTSATGAVTSTSTSSIAPMEFTQFGGCADAFFWAVTADDTVAITIYVEVQDRPKAVPFERSYDLATDDGITVEMIEGGGLAQSFCNDVIDASVTHTDRIGRFRVGTVEVALDPASSEIGGFSSGSATLTGARTADGALIGTVTFETDQIGSYSG